MNSNLLSAALEIIPNPQMLVNVVRLRVKQLGLGHRPLVAYTPGLGLADVALREIIDQKLTFASTADDGVNAVAAAATVVPFPRTPAKKAA